MSIEKNLWDNYCRTHSSEYSPFLQEIENKSFLHAADGSMISGFAQGRLLSLISRLLKPDLILEIGSFTGYSSICLAEGLADGGRLITIESNKSLKPLLELNITASGLGARIEIKYGSTLEILPTLDLELFNLVFVDAAKMEYQKYYEILVDGLKSGSNLLIDNVLWKDEVLQKDKKGIAKAMDDLNKFVKDDPRVDNFILPLNDGLNIIKKK